MENIKITLKAARINAGLSLSEVAKLFSKRFATVYSRQRIGQYEKSPGDITHIEADYFSEIYQMPKDNIIFLNPSQLKVDIREPSS
ncbi:hypothetical protein [Macrococcus equipercicus]|uniref:XRE family transcriptional regulator n=1 Tax=Macrococcus equipercicus TaxID=69967 RepID=A0A9Q9BST2_9STAP|nr:hypothetical protein [Macrococcus equipercicus]UTH13326.1 hypothetical protein KFV11_08640 [Macrococcus equipercicus]